MVSGYRMVVSVPVVHPPDRRADRQLQLPLPRMTRKDCNHITLTWKEIKIQILKYSFY